MNVAVPFKRGAYSTEPLYYVNDFFELYFAVFSVAKLVLCRGHNLLRKQRAI